MKNVFRQLQKRLAKDHSLVFFDIETSYMLARIWRTGEQYIGHEHIVKGTETRVISIQWKFEGDKKVSYLTWDKNQCDKTMLRKFISIINDAKVAISQNGKAFDHKTLRERIKHHKLPALKEVIMLDALLLSRESFNSPSHTLDWRSEEYGLGGKIKMIFQDWINVVELKLVKALRKMVVYGCKDVTDLQKVFWRELPYYKTMPLSFAVLLKEPREHCPRCASRRQKRFDVYPTKVGNKKMMICRNCNHKWKETRLIT